MKGKWYKAVINIVDSHFYHEVFSVHYLSSFELGIHY